VNPDRCWSTRTDRAAALLPAVDGRSVTFEARDGASGPSTGSSCNVLGAPVEGPLAGTRLDPVISGSHFWFAWSVFRPHTRVILESRCGGQ